MSSEYEAVIIVGYAYKEMDVLFKKLVSTGELDGDLVEFEDWLFDEFIGNTGKVCGKEIQAIQPYYDAEWSESLFGIVVEESGSYSYNSLLALEDFSMYINKMSEMFSISPKVYLSVNWS